MDIKKHLKKFRFRVAKEGLIKAVLLGLTVGLGVNAVLSLVFWYFGVKQFWISILAFVLVSAALIPIFFYKKFNPKNSEVAARIDRLGLEERILTMTQFKDDNSIIAQRQRADALKMLNTVSESLIRIAVSVPLIVCFCITIVAGASATAVSALSEKSLAQIIEEEKKKNDTDEIVYFEVSYDVQNGEGGTIEGDLFQIVESGTNANPVEAIAEDEYVFVGWSDGYEFPYREDMEIAEDITVFAIFEPISDGDEDGDGEGDGEEGGEGEEGEGSQDGESGPPSDSSSDNQSGADGEGTGGSGASNPNNQVFDGDTFYGDEYANSLSEAQGDLNSNSDLGQSESDVASGYMNNIAK